MDVRDATSDPNGFQTLTAATSTALTVPAGSKYAIIQALTQNVRWRDDGTAPTAAIGIRLTAGADLFYTGELANLRFIQEAATAEINVSYYS